MLNFKDMSWKDMVWPIIYGVVVYVANYTATWFIPLPFGFIAVGTMLFGATFTARDYAHRLGRPKVYTMIVIAVIGSIILAWLGEIPGRIILASGLAIFFSEATDTEIYQKFIKKPWLTRMLYSNAVSIPLDTLLFNVIAFAGVFSLPLMASIVMGEVIVKYIIGVLMAVFRIKKRKDQAVSVPVLE